MPRTPRTPKGSPPDVSSPAQAKGPSGPYPELGEPKRADPGLRDLSFADWRAVFVRAGKETMDDNVPMMASALAYSAFFAIPSVLLLVLGVFTLVADTSTIDEIVDKLTTVAPQEVANLFGESLQRLSERPSAGILLTVVGLVLALWSLSSAMSTVITALNIAYDRDDRRGFARKRLTALGLGIAVGAAVLLAGTLLVMGPHLQSWLGDALGAQTVVAFVWWIGQWPILVVALLLAFALVLSLVAAGLYIASRSAASTAAESPPVRGLTRLTYGAGLQTDVTWSPDGRRVAYAWNKEGNFDI